MEYRPLGSLVNRKIGYGIVQPGPSVPGGVPVIKVNNLISGLRSPSELDTTTRENDARYSRTRLRGGELLISVVGTIGKTAIVPDAFAGCNLVRATALIDIADALLTKWVRYYLASPSGRAYMEQNLNTTVQPTLNIKALTEMPIPLFSRAEMEKAVSVLSALDEKIETNNKTNDHFTDLLQTIYQERFGNASLAANRGILADICSYSKDKAAVVELNVSTYFSTENMLPGKAGSTVAASLPTTLQTTACRKGDTLVSNIRPYFKKIVYCEGECGCSPDVLCFTPNQPQYSAYLFSTLYADKFFAFMAAGSKGTKMPRGDKRQIMTYPVALPSKEDLAGFNSIAAPLLEQICSNRAENKRLSLLRDTFLPKLLSGTMDISAIKF